MTKTAEYCPHCDTDVELLSADEDEQGNPVPICPYCGENVSPDELVEKEVHQ